MSKKRKTGLPKHIGGVKIPKSIRRGPLGEFIASQTGQALLADAVLTAGKALARGDAPAANDAPDRLAYAFCAAVQGFREAVDVASMELGPQAEPKPKARRQRKRGPGPAASRAAAPVIAH